MGLMGLQFIKEKEAPRDAQGLEEEYRAPCQGFCRVNLENYP